MEALSVITAYGEAGFPAVALIAALFTRLSALVLFLPGLGERIVPMRVRLGAAMAITLMLIPAVLTDGVAPPQTLSRAALMIAAEGICGALIGFSIRIAVYALQTAGAIASQTLSLAQLFGPSMGDQPESPIATLLMMAGLVLAVSSGLHFEIVRVLIISFDIMPFGAFPGTADTGEWAAERAAHSFAMALSLALPFVIVGFIYNLAIGAANRAMPQLMVAFVGVPAVTFAGLVLLAIAAPVILGVWLDMLQGTLDALTGTAR